MSDNEYMPILDQAGFLVLMFIAGNPRPDSTSLTLYFNDQKISEDDFGYSLTLTSFSIFLVSSDRHGKYTIEVSNNEGSANASFLLTIQSMLITREPCSFALILSVFTVSSHDHQYLYSRMIVMVHFDYKLCVNINDADCCDF